MSNEIQRHERYKQYAEKVYHFNSKNFPQGTKVLAEFENTKTGFYANVLQENNRIVIVYKGTDISLSDISGTMKDGKNDANMALRKQIPEQTKDALEVYDRVKHVFPNAQIDVVGHSLGGSLAQYVAIMRNVNEAVTFNPVGIGKSMDGYLSKYGSKTSENKVINYNNPDDNLTKYFRGELYGTNYSISEIDKNGNKHSLENMKPLSTRQKANPSYKGQDVRRKSSSDKSGKNPCVGSYPVSGYTRSNGVEVKGYTRHCGAKHLSSSDKNSNRSGFAPEQQEIKRDNGGCWGGSDVVMSAKDRQKVLDKYKGKKAQDLSKSEIAEFLRAYL